MKFREFEMQLFAAILFGNTFFNNVFLRLDIIDKAIAFQVLTKNSGVEFLE